jgi:nucleoside-diphosphate-sugar epimerase
VYNLASGHEITIRDLAVRINTCTGNTAAPTYLPRRNWDRSGRRFGDPTKARVQLGFEARVSHEEGIRRTVEWTRDSLPLIERCIGAHRHRLQ